LDVDKLLRKGEIRLKGLRVGQSEPEMERKQSPESHNKGFYKGRLI
jgi:hypothetical protein